MKKRILALLVAISFVLPNTAVAYAADNDNEILLEEELLEENPTDNSTEESLVEDLDEEDIKEENLTENLELTEDEEVTFESETGAETAAKTEAMEEDGFVIPAGGYIEPENLPEVENPDLSVRAEDSSFADFSEDYKTIRYYKTPGLPSLRNQSPYGTCWAHASMAMAEINLIKQGIYPANGIDLSEYHLAYFAYNTAIDPLGGTAGDTTEYNGSKFILDYGGNYELAFETLFSWIGAADEETARYSEINKNSVAIDVSKAFDDKAHITNAYRARISSEENDINAVKKLIYNNGAVGANILASDSYRSFYNQTYNSYYVPEHYNANHAVTIVGWDDNFPKENFNTTAPGNGAWIVRNSWMDKTMNYPTDSFRGYFYMSYYDQTISGVAYSFTFERADELDHNYQYDGARNTSYDSVDAGANVFTTRQNEVLKSVSFLTQGTDTDYTIDVYTFENGQVTDPESGYLCGSTTGKTTYDGYYTVDLSEDIYLPAGTTFSVVVTFNADKNSLKQLGYEAAASYDNWYITRPSAQPGQSFTKKNNEWSDFGEANNKNLRIKAFTKDYTQAQDVIPSSVIIRDSENSPLTIGVEAVRRISATVYPSNATNKKLIWTSDNEAVAKIVSMGSTAKVKGIAPGTATITATTQSGEVSASVTVKVKNKLNALTISGIRNIIGDPKGSIGEEFTFKADPSPANYEMTDLVWSSSDASVLSIDASGKAKVLKTGKVTITAQAEGITAKLDFSCVPERLAYVRVVVDEDNVATIYWPEAEGAESYTIYDGSKFLAKIPATGANEYSFKDKRFKGTDTETSSYYHFSANSPYGASYASEFGYFGRKSKITYVLNGGKNSKYNPTCYVPGATSYKLYDPTASGRGEFLGWYTTEDFSGQKVTGINRSATGDLTFYAKWEKEAPIDPADPTDPTNPANPENPSSADEDEEVVSYESLGSAVITSDLTVTIPAGTAIGTVKPIVTYDGENLTLNKDYTLRYVSGSKTITDPDNTKAAYGKEYTVYIAAAEGSKFLGEASQQVKIKVSKVTPDTPNDPANPVDPVEPNNPVDPADPENPTEPQGDNRTDIKTAKIEGLKGKYQYKSNSTELGDFKVYIVKNGVRTNLVKDTDYTVRVVGTGATGKANVVLTGIGNYKGTLTKKITVKTADLKKAYNQGNLDIQVEDGLEYVKSGVKPNVVVKLYGEELTPGKDYKVTYKNNKAAEKTGKKAPYVTVKGIGACKGSVNVKFAITKGNIQDADVIAKDVKYNAKGKKGYFFVKPTLRQGGKTLSNGRNKDVEKLVKSSYSYKYAADTTLADGSQRIEGEPVLETDKILPGTEIAVSVAVKVSDKSNYTAGEYTITGTYRVFKSTISKATVKFATGYTPSAKYGENFEIGQDNLKVSLNGKVLTDNDYELVSAKLSYSGKTTGKIKVVIKGKGIYSGTRTVTLTFRTR